ncbi:hypothetical protein ABPG75_001140 [Micractinium tetrahymenae]
MATAAASDAPLAAATTATNEPLRLDDKLKQQFNEQLQLTAIRVPKQATSQYMKLLSKHLFNKPRLRNVLEDAGSPDTRLLLLDETLTEAELASRDLGGEPARTLADFVQAEGLQVATATVDVDYSYWPAYAVLQRLLPPGMEVPSSFESVGHIAHLNLREELLPYKFIIGQVILDKNPRLQTVVNKVASIENEFRVFPMELLAGKQGMETEVRQHGARFRLDFSKVYWNSRLEREHQRLVQVFQPGEVVLDAMAGIGPFAVPAAQKGCLVYANDLNPASYESLCTNIKINRVGGKVLPFNMDGRQFMRQAAAGQLDVAAAAAIVPPAAPKAKSGQQQQQPQQNGEEQQQQPQQNGEEQQQQQPAQGQQAGPADPQAAQKQQAAAAAAGQGGSCRFQHIVMNLPAAAVDFLDALKGAFSLELWEGHPLPLVHVYTFTKGEEELAGLRQRVEASLGGPLDEEPQLHIVRDVAPKKLMVAVTFRVPPSIAFASTATADEPAKRQRVE